MTRVATSALLVLVGAGRARAAPDPIFSVPGALSSAGDRTAALSGLFFANVVSSEDEPPLQAIVDALGLQVNVGGQQAALGAGAAPIGDEVAALLFERAGPGPIHLVPLACFAVKGL